MIDFALARLRWIAGAKSGSAAVAQTILTRVFLLFIFLTNSVITARHFGTDGRGTQTAIGLWLQILTFACTFGIPAALLYHGRKHANDRGELFGAAIILGLLFGTVALLIGIVCIPTFMHKYGATPVYEARLIMLLAPMEMLGLVFVSMLSVCFDFAFANLTRYGPPLATLATLLTLTATHHLTPFFAVLSYALPSTAMNVITAVYLFQKSRPQFGDLKRSMRRLLGYGVRIFGSDVLGTFSTQIDQLLVVGLLSASDLGTYTIALQASRILMIFQTSLNVVLLPKAAGLPTHEVLHLVARTARLTIAVTAAAAISLVFVLPFLLPGVYGRDFASGVAVSQVLTVEAVLSAAASTHTQAFTATNRPGIATLLQFGGLATTIPAMFALIPHFGLVGAALALLISTTLRLVLALAAYPIFLKAPIPRLLISKDDMTAVRAIVRGIKPAHLSDPSSP